MYVIASKLAIACATSGTSPRIGWVAGPMSARYPSSLEPARKVAQPSVYGVAFTAAQVAAHDAKASLSHRSSHHCIVTRSPNHMCAISCSSTSATRARWPWVGGLRNSTLSVQVTQPQFSIAPPMLGTKTWS